MPPQGCHALCARVLLVAAGVAEPFGAVASSGRFAASDLAGDRINTSVGRAAISTDACLPEWHSSAEGCPYGTKVGPPSATFTWPSEGVTLLHYVAAFYSSVPFFLLVGFPLLLLWTRGTREVVGIALFWVNAGALVLLKLAFGQRRPEGSCLTSCGMPSGHTMCALAFLTWFAWEAWRRSPAFLGVSACFLLPVGWSRTLLNDHSWLQVTLGGVFGVLLGSTWYALMRLRCTLWLLRWLTLVVPVLKLSYPPDGDVREAAWPPRPAAQGFGEAPGVEATRYGSLQQ